MASRTDKVIKNASVGFVLQLLSSLAQFVARTALIFGLGEYYLGLNIVFTSLVGVLSLTELGLGNAIIFSLYKPLADHDETKTQAYVSLFKQIYRFIGLSVIILAIIVVPFLPEIVNTPINGEIYIVYALFVLNTSFGYFFFNYRTALFQADQRRYLLSYADFLYIVLSVAGQCVAFLCFHDYIAGLVIAVVAQLIRSGFIIVVSKTHYAHFNFSGKGELSRQDKRSLIKNVYAMTIGKASGIAVNYIPPLVISSFIGLTASGLYGNYQLISGFAASLVSQVFAAATASVGNFHVDSALEDKRFVYKEMNLIAYWIYGVVGVCCLVGMSPFISAWVGDGYVLDAPCVWGFVFNLMTAGLLQPTVVFKDGCGVFYAGRYRPLFSCAATIILAFLLVHPFGIAGVVWSSGLSRLLTAFWYDPQLVCKHVLKESSIPYILKLLLYFCAFAVIALASSWLCGQLPGGSWLLFFECIGVGFAVSFFGLPIFFMGTSQFRGVIGMVKGKLGAIGHD